MEKLHVSLEGVNDLSFIIVFFFLFVKLLDLHFIVLTLSEEER
jgi:hypothetical protein